MTGFVAPTSPPVTRCQSTEPTFVPAVQCELNPDHDGLHRNNGIRWHHPIRVLVGGKPPDLATNTQHWIDGNVYLAADEPPL